MKKMMLIMAAVLMVLPFSAFAAKKQKKQKVQKGEYTVEMGKLKIAMEIGYPPFEFFAEDGKTPSGFDVELGKAVGKKLGLNVEFIDTAWDGILAGLDIDRYDCIMSAMTITEERKANYDFTAPYIGNGQSLIVLKDSDKGVSHIDDTKGKKVGYQAETTSDFYMEKYANEHGIKFNPCEYDKVMNAYEDLKFGRIDCVISDNLVAVSYLSKPDTPFVKVWEGSPDEYFGVCVKKGNKELLAKIDSAIEEMKKDGTLKEIYMKIFGMDLSSSIQ